MKEKFVEHRFNDEGTRLIGVCNSILEEYKLQGYKLSLRQLYYQLVARDYIPNSVKSYKKTGNLISDARLAGMVDWDMIEDRGREAVVNSHWSSPASIIRTAANAFRLDHWNGQDNYVEVFVEKDALSGILIPVCEKLDIRFTANKGYSSSSAMYEAAYRFVKADGEGKSIHVIYLGDHDPSGIDMTRDIQDRFNLFSREDFDINVHRLALNFNQVEEWQPPENPAKETDSRYESYSKKFGFSSWELDAVEPATLSSLVENTVVGLIDFDIWEEVEEKQSAMRKELRKYADDYESRDN